MRGFARMFDLVIENRVDGRVGYLLRATSLERYTAGVKFKNATATTHEAMCTRGPVDDWFAVCNAIVDLHQHRKPLAREPS